MSKEDTSKKCPDCNCPECPQPQCPQPQCPKQITMDDIIRAVMPGKSPFYTIGEFHMNGSNVDTDLTESATDRWEKEVPDTSGIQPYNPQAQGIMPFSSAIHDKYAPYKLENTEDMFNLKDAIDYRIDRKLVDQLRIPGSVKNSYSDRGQNSTNSESIEN